MKAIHTNSLACTSLHQVMCKLCINQNHTLAYFWGNENVFGLTHLVISLSVICTEARLHANKKSTVFLVIV